MRKKKRRNFVENKLYLHQNRVTIIYYLTQTYLKLSQGDQSWDVETTVELYSIRILTSSLMNGLLLLD